MLSPGHGGGSDQQLNRLERILELVTEHEKVYREQVHGDRESVGIQGCCTCRVGQQLKHMLIFCATGHQAS